MKTIYNSFIKEVNLKEKSIDQVTWHYYHLDGGHKENLLILPGTSGDSSTYFPYIQELKNHYNILAINYPDYHKLHSLLDGLENLVSTFNWENMNILSNSFGTLISQLLVKRNPSRYLNLFMINPSTKTHRVDMKDIQSHIKSYKKQLHVLNGIFPFLYRTSYKRNIKTMVYSTTIDDKKFWFNFYYDGFKSTKREKFIAIYECLLDFWSNENFNKNDFNEFKGDVHIFKSDINLSKSKSEFEEVENLFNGASVHTLDDNQNLAMIRHFDIIVNKILNV